MNLQRIGAWIIPSKAEWKAMLLGGLYVLAGRIVLGVIVGGYSPPFGDQFLARPILLTSMVLSDFNSLIISLGIPDFPFLVLCGMLGGLIIYWMLRRQARRHLLSGGDGWRAGARAGAWIAIPLVLLVIFAPYGIIPTSQRIAASLTILSGWRITQYLNMIRFCSLFILLIAAPGAVLGKLLFASGIAAGAGLEAEAADHGNTQRIAAKPGIVGLLLLSFFAMYFHGAIFLLLPRTSVTPNPSTFMTTGDFGILSQKPCGPPCFEGIQPGVTTFDDAALILKNASVPCKDNTSSSGKSLICGSIDTSITVSTSRLCTTDNTGPLVGGIGLLPPTKITLKEFIAQYGPPDLLQISPIQEAIFFYDSLQTALLVSRQPGQQTYTFMPGTTIDQVVYVTPEDYSKCLHMAERDQQPWTGYGKYTSPGMNP